MLNLIRALSTAKLKNPSTHSNHHTITKRNFHHLGTADPLSIAMKENKSYAVIKAIVDSGTPIHVWHLKKTIELHNLPFFNLFQNHYKGYLFEPCSKTGDLLLHKASETGAARITQILSKKALNSNKNLSSHNDIINHLNDDNESPLITAVKNFSHTLPRSPALHYMATIDILLNNKAHTEYTIPVPKGAIKAHDDNVIYSSTEALKNYHTSLFKCLILHGALIEPNIQNKLHGKDQPALSNIYNLSIFLNNIIQKGLFVTIMATPNSNIETLMSIIKREEDFVESYFTKFRGKDSTKVTKANLDILKDNLVLAEIKYKFALKLLEFFDSNRGTKLETKHLPTNQLSIITKSEADYRGVDCTNLDDQMRSYLSNFVTKITSKNDVGESSSTHQTQQDHNLPTKADSIIEREGLPHESYIKLTGEVDGDIANTGC